MGSKTVVPIHEPDDSGAPERASRSSQDPEVFQGSDYPILDEKNHSYVNNELFKPLPDLPSSRLNHRRRRLTLIVVTLLILAVAAGLGGYFGHRVAEHNPSPASSGSSPAINDNNGTHGTDVSNSSTTRPLENIADALNGTSFASISYDSTGKYNGDSAQQNYVLFYQCSNGDIRKKIYNETKWHPSEIVTDDARLGTGLSAIWFGDPPILIYIYYIDKSGLLQELRGSHATNEWSNGTLGAANFKTVETHSALSAQFQGRCGDRGQLGWVFYESNEGVQEALWHYDNDTWSYGNLFRNIQPGSSFSTTLAPSEKHAWRFFGTTKKLQLQEYACEDCCKHSDRTWETGLNATFTSLSTLGLAVTTVTSSRMLYYQSPTLNLRELNNTDFNRSASGLVEGWAVVEGSQVGNVTPMRGSRLSVSTGFRGKTNQIWVFFQTNGSDISVVSRNEHDIAGWGVSEVLNIGV